MTTFHQAFQSFILTTFPAYSSQYSLLNSDAQSILQDTLPVQGLSGSFSKNISSHLRGLYSIGIPQKASFGVLFSSIGFDEGLRKKKDLPIGGLVSTNESYLVELGNSRTESTSQQQPSPPPYKDNQQEQKPFLLYGRIFQDSRLEALACSRLSPSGFAILSGLDSLQTPSTSFLHAQYVHSYPKWTIVGSAHSTGHVLGLNTLYTPSQSSPLSIGTEVYVSMKEKSGGLSFGGRYKEVLSSDNSLSSLDSEKGLRESSSLSQNSDFKDKEKRWFSLVGILNPMMGHFTSSFTATIAPRCIASTQYSFNLYSIDSDLSAGLEYRTSPTIKSEEEQQQEQQQQCIKLRWSLQRGLGIGFETLSGLWLVALGLELDVTGPQPISRFGVSLQL